MKILSVLCLLLVFGASSTELDWWETSVIYQVYPRSFKDSNGDGVGDINRIIEKLDYIKELGVDAIWIQPVYRSPMVDMGYDPISMKEIDPLFGTMEDMKNLIQASHERKLKVVMDFVPNHVSDQSEWFKRSVNRDGPYTDYFVWHDGKRINDSYRTEPNNWVGWFEKSAWKWNEKRQQYYYRLFKDEQPDLNVRNPAVQAELEDVLRFWLDMGVDGFRVDAIPMLFEAAHLQDEPVTNDVMGLSNTFFKRIHIYTQDQPENLDILHRWRQVLDEYKLKDGITRLLSVEDPFGPKKLIPYFGNETFPAAHIPFNFGLINFYYTMNATKLDSVIHDFLDVVPKNRLPNWLTDSHDRVRTSSRMGADAVNAFMMMNLILPGSACVYYGSEIGLEDSMIRDDQKTDKASNALTFSRDRSRGPMPWDDTKNGGFTTNKTPWLPLSTKYWTTNVKSQLHEANSHLKIFKRLMTLRKTVAVKYGDLETHVVNTWTYLFTRKASNDTVAVVINLGSESEAICSEESNFGLPETMFVHTGSLNSGFKIGDKVRIISSNGHSCTELRPKAGLVLTTYPTSAAIVWSPVSWLLILGMGILTLR
nr:PREDICTED: probable maltase [Bemisia tabaci]